MPRIVMSQYLSEYWADVMEISYNITHHFNYKPDVPRNWDSHDGMDRFNIHMAKSIMIVVDARYRDYVKNVCPNITDQDINNWKADLIDKMIEPFNWLNTPQYQILYFWSKHCHFEQLMPRIVKGDFGSGLHKAAAKCMLLDTVQNSGFIPFSYKVRKYVYQNFEWWVICSVNVFDMDTKWIHRLKDFIESGEPFPVDYG